MNYNTSVFISDADIRLVGSRLSHEGRLEVKVGGIWGTVCDDSFSDTGAEVACYMLGFGLVTQMYKI